MLGALQGAAQPGVRAWGMAQAIPLLTYADPTAARRPLTEGYVTQPLAMAHVDARSFQFTGTLDLEGLTLQRGELTTGAWGEGYVDRRHPHTYVHEAMLSATASLPRGVLASLSVGRGFAPFGSDDPMVRPLVKYPMNHHLAQILERVGVIGAVQAGAFILEGATFNGDEPVSPSSAPNWNRIGDSWSARATFVPVAAIELAASYANVKSPESHLGGLLDQRKQSAYARYANDTRFFRYGLVEWARTDEISDGRRAFTYETVLVEGLACRGGVQVAARAERTSRPEEERTLDPFRSVRPLTDVGILGISQWGGVTVMIAAPSLMALGPVRVVPLLEGSAIRVAAGNPPGLFDPQRQYGAQNLVMLSAGVRLNVGRMSGRMGRYAAALPRRGSSTMMSAHSHTRTARDRCDY